MENYSDKNKYYFYNGLPQKSAVAELTATLRENVQPQVLREACRAILARHYFFRKRPLLNEKGDIVCEDSTAEPPVMPDEGNVLLGTEATNGYLFRIAYWDRDVRFVFSHALADGHGGEMFFRSVLYEYMRRLGYLIDPDETILLAESVEDAGERGDVYTDLPGNITPKPPERVEKLFITPEERTLMETDCSRCWVLRFAESSVKEQQRKYDCSPVPLFSVLIGNAMHQLYSIHDETILTGVPVDMRRFLNSKALANYSSMVLMPYPAKWHDLPLTEQIAQWSGEFQQAIQPEELFSTVAATAARKLPFMSMDDRETILAGMQERIQHPGIFTYLLTSVGKIRLPAGMDEHIEDMRWGAVEMSHSPSMMLYTYGGNVYFGMVANFTSDALFMAIKAQLEGIGLQPELIIDGYTQSDTVRTDLFAHV